MKFVIAGGTGFIGSYLLRTLSGLNHDIVLLTRSASGRAPVSPRVRYVPWDATTFGEWTEEINGADVVLNLAGKNLIDQRWNADVKRKITHSRLHSTDLLVETIAQSVAKPSLLISASAIGYYGDSGTSPVDEHAAPGTDFLAQLVAEWERTSQKAARYGVRVVNPRIGLVLQKDGGLVPRLRLPFTLFVGGWVGSGRQFASWIHMDDVIKAILFPIDHDGLTGPYNVTSPNPVPMKEFCSVFGQILKRPSWLPVPNLALRTLYGEATDTITSGQRVIPQKLLDNGFPFTYPDLRSALSDILL